MSELLNAIKQICEEKGLSYESVIATIEQALAAAYRKDFGQKNQNIQVEFNPETTKSKVFDVKTVVEDMPEEEEETTDDPVQRGQMTETDEIDIKSDDKKKKDKKEESKGDKDKKKDENKEEKSDKKSEAGEFEEERKFNPRTEIQISDAKEIKKTAKIGEEIKTKLDVPEAYGRMAAQTAKQVIIQRLREAEREMIFSEFKDKEKEVVSGVVQRREGRAILVDLGKSVGYLPAEEQIFGEKYNPGERIKVYIKEVRMGSKGAEIILSRTVKEILKKVFYLEIPEISNGLVELKSVAREAGSRSKVAVWTDSDNVDPIGSCVGQRGARIQTIISELGGEKVDIILYDEDPAKFIANALSPAKILNIETEEKIKKATVKVQNDQLSLAIGKNGQNARLAARLTGWKVNIVEAKEAEDKKQKKDDSREDQKKDEKGEKKQKKEKVKDDKKEKDENKKNKSEKKSDEMTDAKDGKKDKKEASSKQQTANNKDKEKNKKNKKNKNEKKGEDKKDEKKKK